jgi:hypothetical protein
MSGDGSKLYIYGAGFDIAVYDTKTLKPVTDWEMTNDITMAGLLLWSDGRQGTPEHMMLQSPRQSSRGASR